MTERSALLGGGYPCACPQSIAFSLVLDEHALEEAQNFRPIDWVLDMLGLADWHSMFPNWRALTELVADAPVHVRDWLVLAHIDGLQAAYDAAMAEVADMEASDAWYSAVSA